MLLATTWLDYVAAIGTAVGAVATFCAVVVALFGPAWREKQKRPQLSLSPETDMTTSIDGSSALEARIWIRNALGRDTAEGVEVFVDAQGPHIPGAGTVLVATGESLNFDRPRPDEAGRSTATVPAGHSRPVYFAVWGSATAIATRFDPSMRSRDDAAIRSDAGAALALYGSPRGLLGSLGSREILWLEKDTTYDVRIVVTGANFDAVAFRGQVRISEKHERVDADGPEMVEYLEFSWLDGLHDA
jgi:hypothetical protein